MISCLLTEPLADDKIIKNFEEVSMLTQEKGTLSGSDIYFTVPSENARRMLYYSIGCGYFYTNADYHVKRENYGCYLLIYVCEGELYVRSESKTATAKAGQIVFLDCHTPHEYRTLNHCEFVWTHIDGANTADFYGQCLQKMGSFVFGNPRADSLREQLFAIVYAYRNNQTVNEWQQSLKLYSVLVTVLSGMDPGREETLFYSETTNHAIKYIMQNYPEPISLSDLAREVNMSPYHFSRKFKRECGYSPHEYLIITRINRAMYLLKTTDLPIKTISSEVGYEYVTTFSALFMNRIGLSPSDFRKYPF